MCARSNLHAAVLVVLAEVACTTQQTKRDAPEGPSAKSSNPESAEAGPAAPERPERGESTSDEPSEPVFVHLGRRTPVGSPIAKPVPHALLGLFWDYSEGGECEPDLEPALALLETARPDEARFATPELVEELGVTAPTEPVWLIGPAAPCRATLGRPLLGFHPLAQPKGEALAKVATDDTIIELAWELSGCTTDEPERWSPVGLQGAAVDPKLRWHPAEAPSKFERFDPERWQGPLAEEVAAFADEAAEQRREVPDWWMQRVAVPGTDLGELVLAALWRARPPDPRAAAYTCGDPELVHALTLRDGQALDLPDDTRGKLIGALAAAGEARFVVYDSGGILHVAPLEPGSDEVDELAVLDTGAYDPEALELRGYSVIGPCGP